jgi:BED zinc finger
MFKVNSGRKKDSPVWSYFEYEPSSNKSRCTVKVGDGGQCGLLLVGKNTTNLRNHIESKHKTVFKELIAVEKQEKQSKETSGQVKLNLIKQSQESQSQQTVSKPLTLAVRQTWDPESAEYKKRQQAIIKYVISTGAPVCQVGHQSFKEMCSSLDPKFKVPGI